MKKLSITFALVGCLGAAHAQSVEKLDANVSARTNSGKDRVYRFTLEYKADGENVTGQFISYDSTRCGRERAFTGTLKGDILQVRSEESELQGCGRLNFTGKKEADGSIVGKMQFQGEQREFVFKK